MIVTIEIPPPFINGENTMVNISGDTFHYSRIDKRYHALQSQFSQVDRYKDARLMKHLDIISEQVVEIVKERLM